MLYAGTYDGSGGRVDAAAREGAKARWRSAPRRDGARRARLARSLLPAARPTLPLLRQDRGNTLPLYTTLYSLTIKPETLQTLPELSVYFFSCLTRHFLPSKVVIVRFL